MMKVDILHKMEPGTDHVAFHFFSDPVLILVNSDKQSSHYNCKAALRAWTDILFYYVNAGGTEPCSDTMVYGDENANSIWIFAHVYTVVKWETDQTLRRIIPEDATAQARYGQREVKTVAVRPFQIICLKLSKCLRNRQQERRDDCFSYPSLLQINEFIIQQPMFTFPGFVLDAYRYLWLSLIYLYYLFCQRYRQKHNPLAGILPVLFLRWVWSEG